MGRLYVEISPMLVEACTHLTLGQKKQFEGAKRTVEIVRESAWVKIVVFTESVEPLVKCGRDADYQVQLALSAEEQSPSNNHCLLNSDPASESKLPQNSVLESTTDELQKNFESALGQSKDKEAFERNTDDTSAVNDRENIGPGDLDSNAPSGTTAGTVTSQPAQSRDVTSEEVSDSEGEVCEPVIPIKPKEEEVKPRKRGRPRKNATPTKKVVRTEARNNELKRERGTRTKGEGRSVKERGKSNAELRLSLPSHECKICGASFGRVLHLRKHMISCRLERNKQEPEKFVDNESLVQNGSCVQTDSPTLKDSSMANESSALTVSSMQTDLSVQNDSPAASDSTPKIKRTTKNRTTLKNVSAFKISRRALKSRSSAELYNCQKCSKGFKRLDYLRHHVKRKHGNELDILTDIETKRALVRKKKLKTRKEDLVACPVCSLGFQKHAKGILAHITKVHPKYDSTSFLADLKNQPSYTPKKVPDLPASASANETAGSRCPTPPDGDLMTKVPCELCQREFLDTVILFHVENAHSGVENLQEVVARYKGLLEGKAKAAAEQESRDQPPQDCMFCGKTCKKIVQHMRRCRLNPDSVQTKQCACGFRVKTREALALHKETCKLNSCTFLCDLCGLEFSSKSNMYYHRRSKHGICGKNRKLTICPCPECGKVFPAPSRLRKHMTVHTGVRDYICETCGKDFKISEHLRHHVVTKHLGRYRYHCEKCGHGINKRQKLKTHKCDRVRRLQGPDVGEFAVKKQLEKEQKDKIAAERQLHELQQQQLAAANTQAVPTVIDTNHLTVLSNQAQPTQMQPMNVQLESIKAEVFKPEVTGVAASVMYSQPTRDDIMNIKPELHSSVYPQQAIPQQSEQSQQTGSSPLPLNAKSQTAQAYYTPDLAVSQPLSLIGPHSPLSLVQPLASVANTVSGIANNAGYEYLNNLPSMMFDMQQFRVGADGTLQVFNPTNA